MKRLLPLLVFIITVNAFSQPVLLWQKTYGGSDHEYAWKTISTTDGGLAFVGFSDSNDGDVAGNHGSTDLWVAKTDATGNLQWSKLYGGSDYDEGYAIIQTSDGGFMVAGYTESADGDVTGHHGTYDSDFWLLKLNASGDLIWNKCYGGTYSDEAEAMVQSSDGHFFIAGETSSTDGDVSGLHGSNTDIWVIKTDASGNLLGQKCIGGTDYDEGIGLASTSDNGCIVSGRTSSADGDAVGYHGGSDMLIAKLSSALQVEWAHCYGGSETEECNAVVQLSDGSYTALGYTSTHNNGDVTGHHGSQGSDDFWLVKLTSAGAITWARCYGGDGDDQANGLAKTADGGYVMCGLTNSTNGDVAGFHSGGFFDPDIWVCKLDANGLFQWQRCCGGSGQDESFNIYEEGSGSYMVTGFTYSSNYDVTLNRGSADGWLLRVSGSTGMASLLPESVFGIYPNPATSTVELITDAKTTLEITDEKLSLLKSQVITDTRTVIDIGFLPKGVYLFKAITEKGTSVRKLIKL